MNLNLYGLSVINCLGCQMQASPLVDGVGGYDLAWQVVDLMLCQPALCQPSPSIPAQVDEPAAGASENSSLPYPLSSP